MTYFRQFSFSFKVDEKGGEVLSYTSVVYWLPFYSCIQYFRALSLFPPAEWKRKSVL